MIRPLRIFVEGGTDIKFLKDLILYEFGILLSEQSYVKTAGWTYLFSEKNINQLRRTTDDGGLNLVIIDTDTDFEDRYNWLVRNALTNRVLFSFFLFPTHQLLGDRESLLQSIANPAKYIPFAECFEPYMTCLEAYNSHYIANNNQPLAIPNRKINIYNYLAIHRQVTREHDRNYRDASYWNLAHESLSPLKNFLRPYFT